MSIQVWKYELKIENEQWIELPHGAKILNIDVQRGVPCLWAQVDTNMGKTSTLIVTHGTGHKMRSGDMTFLGTYQFDDGSFVGHVFMPLDEGHPIADAVQDLVRYIESDEDD